MTDRETAARLQAALQSRAEIAMSSTDTARELERLHKEMGPVNARRRRAMLVAAAAVVVVGGGLGLGLGLTGGSDGTHGAPGTILPATTAPDDFPVGTYTRPGTTPIEELNLSRSGAFLRPSLERSELAFPAAGQVQFSCLAGRHSPCASPCLYTYHLSGSTLEFQLVHTTDLCGSDDFVSRAPWQRGGSQIPSDYPAGSWVRTGSQGQATLSFSAVPSARLLDQIGFNNEPLSFAGPHTIVFGASQPSDYCPASDTYRFSVAKRVLRFTPIGPASCARRLDFLTAGKWLPTG